MVDTGFLMCYNNFSDAAKGKKTEGDMFGGRVDHQLDEKNRMRIPKMYLEGGIITPLNFLSFVL